jgi:uncharacterized protein (DUF1499 family)
MKFLLFTGVILSSAATAHADANEDFIWATQMAAVIGSADACGFKLDDEKVQALSAGRVAKMDVMTRSNFQATLTITPSDLDRLSPTAKKAQCALHNAVAKSEGLAQ